MYENATPELLRDFFWDDEFRLKWDDMLVHAELLEECPATGTMVVHWTRKVPVLLQIQTPTLILLSSIEAFVCFCAVPIFLQ